MTVSMTLGFEWGLDKMMMLAEQSVHDFDKKEKILEDIDFEHVELPINLWWVDSASKRNLGGVSEYGLLDCFQKSLKAFICSISAKTVIDKQFYAWCMRLAQTEQLSTGNVFAAWLSCSKP
jgi:hypothetical protein